MGLKDKTSLYDLVPGPNDPVGNFEDVQGGPNFDLGQSSTLQQDSLLEIYNYSYGGSPGVGPTFVGQGGPVPKTDIPQDLNGLAGPQFDLGLDSMFHAGPDGPNPTGTSLLSVYNSSTLGINPLPWSAPQNGNPVDQDLNGGFPASGRYQDNLPEGGVY